MLEEEFIPEKRISELMQNFLKKIFIAIIAIISYYQIYEYIIEKMPVNIEITNSIKKKLFFETEFIFNNSGSPIEESDFTKPIEILLSNNIQKIIYNKNQKAVPKFKIEGNKIFLKFDLLNKEEKIVFKTLSIDELNIKSINFRIKDIDDIQFYQYINKPKPLERLTNFWLIVFGLSIIFFFDALLLILKDAKLSEMKYLIRNYPLNEKNKYDFMEKYRQLYKDYKVRFKLPDRYLIDFKIKNLLDMYDAYTSEDIRFIKFMINFNTELSIMYRIRTIFIIISPILILTSITGIALNYFYYEIKFLSIYSLDDINIVLLRIILLLIIIMILFPRTTMNYVFIKRNH
ncbi:hypothetical protein VT569_08600 [Flavobacterium psychrophilum]|uniref:hypothetical protein n=3 Tax=Flavobacterium psychrophilum TaxID=96345 RepID=UPI000B7C2A9D|nr:hypothetical protein [Flavobacterium psychrophilum]EKT4498418.1 hypothetical protein [Flavobacterium psychrophilum]ELI6454638.1 hypothetical protein [Flavobacterium psychrophilum]ELM3649545.1 hypothetical protein [Flavobacterium psychrophilum]ELM3670407.1 hypothetical protein [Flavobacterium psychrophilum]ELM3725363.1 hypothetical protein [Flavobacterium psychrophilum]